MSGSKTDQRKTERRETTGRPLASHRTTTAKPTTISRSEIQLPYPGWAKDCDRELEELKEVFGK